jgi:hypothetical protein
MLDDPKMRERIYRAHEKMIDGKHSGSRERIVHDRLDAYREDLASWMSDIMGRQFHESTFFNEISDGIALLELAQKIDRGITDYRYETGYKGPSSISLTPDYRAFNGNMPAYANAHIFLQWARDVGVPYAVLFESEDLVKK